MKTAWPCLPDCISYQRPGQILRRPAALPVSVLHVQCQWGVARPAAGGLEVVAAVFEMPQ